jgi:hypothetical protein
VDTGAVNGYSAVEAFEAADEEWQRRQQQEQGPRCEIAGQVFTTSKVLNQGLLKEKEVVTRHQ